MKFGKLLHVLQRSRSSSPSGGRSGSPARPLPPNPTSTASRDESTSERGARIAHEVACTTSVPLRLEDPSPPPQAPTFAQHTPSSADINESTAHASGHAISSSQTPSEIQQTWRTTLSNTARMVLEVTKESSDVFTPLKSVFGGLSAVLKQYDQFVANKDDIRRLIDRLDVLSTKHTQPARRDDPKENLRRKILKRNLIKVQETLRRMSEQTAVSGFLNNADQSRQITGLIDDIRDAIIDYQTSLQQDLIESFRELMDSADILLLDRLQPSKDAGYRSSDRPKCLRGTRVDVLETIEAWVQDPASHRVYWLNGVAGSGKTTIAYSVAKRVDASGNLGASFFCSRDFPNRRNLHCIFPTLAFQLAYRYPEFRACLKETNPKIGSELMSLDDQLRMLLVKPLQLTQLSTVVIIDALDECEDKEPESAILSLLARTVDDIPSVKFFITGRPEPGIRSGFRLPSLRPHTEVFLLHEVHRDNVDGDIELFLEHHLKELIKNRSDVDVTIPWPSAEDIALITSKAGGLFIYASTIVNFLKSKAHTPQARLLLVTATPDNTVHEGKAGIDQLYMCILNKACDEVDSNDSDYFSQLHVIVSSIVLLYEPISVTNLAKLLGFENILTPIRTLHSVLLVPDSVDKPIRVLHKSFPDFITDSSRCKEAKFYVDQEKNHGMLAEQCFKVMNTELKRNICDLPQFVMNSDVEDLSARQQKFISGALLYASRFWSKHLSSMSPTGDITPVLDLLEGFIKYCLLQWLEVLSIAKGIRCAVYSLIDVEQWLLKVETAGTLLALIQDCLRFVLYSFDAIEISAAHIYDSVLLWLPKSSVVRSHYYSQLRNHVDVRNATDDSWDSCVRTITVPPYHRMSLMAFSDTGDLMAAYVSYSSDNYYAVEIFEAATGVRQKALHGLGDLMNDASAIAFSSDDMFIVSGTLNKTGVWDLQTGALVKSLEHGSTVISISMGNIVASQTGGCIQIWNLSCGQGLPPKSYYSWGTCLGWCGANNIATVSDGEIKLWDLSSGECVKTLWEAKWWANFKFYQVTLQSDKIALTTPSTTDPVDGSCGICVVDACSGFVLAEVEANQYVWAMALSRCGNMLAYSTRNSVTVWNIRTAHSAATWQVPARGKVAMDFSPNGRHIAILWGNILKVFDVKHNDPDHRDDACTGDLANIAFSPDGQILASLSNDSKDSYTIKLWDVATGKLSSRVHADARWTKYHWITLSSSSSLLALGGPDGVSIWEVRSGILAQRRVLQWCGRIGANTNYNHVTFSPDERQVVCVIHATTSLNSDESTLAIWDAETGETLADGYIASEFVYVQQLSVDENKVVLRTTRGSERRWHIRSNPDPHGLPLLLEGGMETYLTSYWYQAYGWILDQEDRRVCWIPPDRRGVIDYHADKIAIGTELGRLIILDFSDCRRPECRCRRGCD